MLSKNVIFPNKKHPKTEKIKKTRNKRDVTFIKDGIENLKVAINFLSPFRFFINFIKREILKTLNILIIYGAYEKDEFP